MAYAELHSHSAFSFLDGASLPHEMVEKAEEHGYTALALTDHDSVSGSMEHAQAAKGKGVRAIHGAEVTLDDGRHLTLLVREATGWRNLCRLLTRAYAHTRVYGGTPRGRGASRAGAGAGGPSTADRGAPLVPRETVGGGLPHQRRGTRMARLTEKPRVSLAQVAEHAEGLVCLSGCASHGVRDEPTARLLLEAFGRDAFRIELQRPFQRHDRTLNRGLEALASRLGVPCVATGNAHAHTPARARLQDVLTAIREHTTLDASEPLRRGNHSHVLATPAAMAARFADHPEAVLETERLVDTLRFDLCANLGYSYPGADDEAADATLAQVCAARFDGRYPSGSEWRSRAQGRLVEELRVIAKLRLSGFFLLHHEMLELAREVAVEVRGPSAVRSLLPPGRGRGSSVSSIVCYLTGLSHVDPIANDLLLGRFLNEDLQAFPDIDLDFPRDVREVLIPRVHERFGADKSALVAAFPTYKARGAIREIGKALGLPPGEIERVARGSEMWGARSVERDVEVALGEGRRTGRWAWLAELSEEAYGLPRHLSQHSGGMIVSTRPLIDCCPVVPAAMEGRQMVMWDKDSCADAGFLKIDLLGLGMLSSVERCVELIWQRRHTSIDLGTIDYADEATFASIQRAETTGVFQIESRAQMGSLRRTLPKTLTDLTIQVAIVRPGPIVGGAVNPYIERLQRRRRDPSYEVPYDHPSLREPLEATLGTIIFQDQVIEVAEAFAAFSPGEAEGLRRAMSRKRSAEELEKFHRRFVEGGMAEQGVDEALAERVWKMVSGFSGFGFPKAHGAAFGLLAYQSAWLREHYGPEFLCSLLDEQPMGFYPPDALVHEAQRRGIVILPPDVNESAVLCTVVDAPAEEAEVVAAQPAPRTAGHLAVVPPPAEPAPPARHSSAVRLGLGYVLGVRADEIVALVEAREAQGPFRSLDDIAARAGAGRGSLEQLAWSGACDRLVLADAERRGERLPPRGARRAALWQLGIAAPPQRVGAGGGDGTQLALPLDLPAPPKLRPLDRWSAMVADYATTTLTAADHPLGLLRDDLRGGGAVRSTDLVEIAPGANVRVGGLVVARQRPGTAKGVVFLLIEDEVGTVNLILPPPVYERCRLVARTEPLIMAQGRLEKHAAGGGAINVLVDNLAILHQPGATATVTELTPGIAAPAVPGKASDDLAATGTDDFRAVAPGVMNFGAGRRR